MAYIEPPTVLCDGTGFRVSHSQKVLFSSSWENVNRVVGFKKDCFTVDQIHFVIGDGQREVEVTEDDPGWKQLTEMLAAKIPGFPPESEWFPKLAHPAFATNFTILYKKDQG